MTPESTHLGRISKLKRAGFLALKPLPYILTIVLTVFAAYAIKVRVHGIAACPANGYSSDRYLVYCHAENYGDYEHGAFWFNLEPRAETFARSAKALFLGDSRLQLGFSTRATTQWFSAAAAPYYLLGFGYGGNVAFAEELLRKVRPRAKVYIISVDFFERSETPPAREVMHDPGASLRYGMKRLWQLAHEPICKTWPVLCGKDYVVFRSRETGAYQVQGLDKFRGGPATYEPLAEDETVKKYVRSGQDFLSSLPVPRECIMLTAIPTVGTRLETARAVARSLGVRFVAPELEGLQTFDGSHLDHVSAERWSRAFFEAAGPQIRRCLDQPLPS